jgi:divalent metal cation (Fe/Co/Zn/Cd) transporter
LAGRSHRGLIVAAFSRLERWHVFRQSYDQLMDRELPDSERDRIKTIVMRHDDVRKPARSAHARGRASPPSSSCTSSSIPRSA